MRGEDRQQGDMFSYISPEQRVPKDHPLRAIRVMTDEALSALSAEFEKLYARVGRPSIAPEKLLRALVLQALYTVRSERLLIEQLNYNLLFRWFVGLNMDDRVWDATVYTKNRERLLAGDIAQKFFEKLYEQAREQGLLSDEHFTVDGTLIEAWAGHKSFKSKDDDRGGGTSGKNPSVEFRGEPRANDTHQSSTDPEARLYKKAKGQEAKLCYLGHVLMENRNGLVVNSLLTQSTGTAEREAAVVMCDEIEGNHRVTLGADKNYDVRDFIGELRGMKVTAHVAQKQRSAVDQRTTRHPGYQVSQTKRKRVEEIFGWLKTVGLMRKTRHRGVLRVGWMFTFTLAVYNLVRMRNLAPAV
jgi:transposase